jgi:excinuclease UvrABC nuclease subunit
MDMAVAPKNRAKLIKEKERQMNSAVKVLDFETAALLRDEIAELQRLISLEPAPEPEFKKEFPKGGIIKGRKNTKK